MPAVAVTDHANLFALVKFYKAAQSVHQADRGPMCCSTTSGNPPPFPMTLLSRTRPLPTLTQLISRAYAKTAPGVPQLMTTGWKP